MRIRLTSARAAALGTVTVMGLMLLTTMPAAASTTAVPPVYKNCTALNTKYPHGLGRANARDKTSGTPVTTFKRNTRLYNLAISHNKRLDGDKDGVACEKK